MSKVRLRIEFKNTISFWCAFLPIFEFFKKYNMGISFDILKCSLKIELEVKMKSLITCAMGLYGYIEWSEMMPKRCV